MSGKPRPCGCKGYRSCLLCEREFNLLPFKDDGFTAESLKEKVYSHLCVESFCIKLTYINLFLLKGISSYVYCPMCNLAWPGWDYDPANHPNHFGEPKVFPGIYIQVLC
jgi:alkylated DNA repair protein alkB family protein 4